MALTSPRDMPVTTARYHEMRRAWIVSLPGGIELPARDTFEVESLRDKYASGSAIRYVRDALRGGVDEAVAPVRHSDFTPERAGTALSTPPGSG